MCPQVEELTKKDNMEPCTQEHRFNDIEKCVTEIKEATIRIELAIIGNIDTGIEGLVMRVNKNTKFRKLIQKVIWSIGGAGTLIVILWEVYKGIKK